MTKPVTLLGGVLAAALTSRAAAAAPVAIEYIPADIVGLASGQVVRLNVVNGDGDVAAGDVNGRTCRVTINWGDAQGQPLAPSPTTFTLSPGQASFVDLPFDAALNGGAISGNRVMVRPLLQANCNDGVSRPGAPRSVIAVLRPALRVTIEVYDADTGRASVLFTGGVRVRLVR
jgi:hypothetical protein